jgi:hypothetical protein
MSHDHSVTILYYTFFQRIATRSTSFELEQSYLNSQSYTCFVSISVSESTEEAFLNLESVFN